MSANTAEVQDPTKLPTPKEHLDGRVQKLAGIIAALINLDPYCNKGAGHEIDADLYEQAVSAKVIASMRDHWDIQLEECDGKKKLRVKPNFIKSLYDLRVLLASQIASWNFDDGPLRIEVEQFDIPVVRKVIELLESWDVNTMDSRPEWDVEQRHLKPVRLMIQFKVSSASEGES